MTWTQDEEVISSLKHLFVLVLKLVTDSCGAEIARPIEVVRCILGGWGCGGGEDMFVLCVICAPAVGTNISGSPNMGLSPGCECDHSRPSRPELKNEWSYACTPPYAFMVWTGTTYLYICTFYCLVRKHWARHALRQARLIQQYFERHGWWPCSCPPCLLQPLANRRTCGSVPPYTWATRGRMGAVA